MLLDSLPFSAFLLFIVTIGLLVVVAEDDLAERRLLTDPPLEVLKEKVDHQQTDNPPACWPFLGPPSDGSDKAFAHYVGTLEKDTQLLHTASGKVESAALYNPKAGFREYEAFETAWLRLTDTAQDAVDACREYPEWVPTVIGNHLVDTFDVVVVPVREVCRVVGVDHWGTSDSTRHCEDPEDFTFVTAVKPLPTSTIKPAPWNSSPLPRTPR